MFDYRRVRHAFSENARRHPGILEHFEILASLNHRLWTKNEQISQCRIFRHLYFKNEKTYNLKADVHQSTSEYSKNFTIIFKHIFQMGRGDLWKLAICLEMANFLAFFVFLGRLYLKIEKLHNPVGHQCARVLCREDTNHLEKTWYFH